MAGYEKVLHIIHCILYKQFKYIRINLVNILKYGQCQKDDRLKRKIGERKKETGTSRNGNIHCKKRETQKRKGRAAKNFDRLWTNLSPHFCSATSSSKRAAGQRARRSRETSERRKTGNYCCTGKEGSRKYRQAQKRHWRSWMVMALIRKHSFEQSSAISGAELEIWLEINACVGVRKVTNDPLKVQKTRPKMAWCCGWCKQYITLCISMSSQEKYIIIICLFDKQYFFIII